MKPTSEAHSPVIHLVDDDGAVRDSLALLIGTIGLRVQPWADPVAFMEQFDRQGIGAIVLDVRMPGISGLSVLDTLVAQRVDQPVIMLTGHGTVEMCRRAFKAGAAEFLEKPVNDELLIEALQNAVRQHVRTRERHQADREARERYAQLSEREQEVLRAKSAYREDALERLQAIQGERDMVREQLREAVNILERATINAPVSGTVVRIHYHTNGGVIESGKAILEILPAGVPLIIEAQISRNDIDSVKLGQEATIRLVGLNQRTTPVIMGQVFYLSADALQQSSSGSSSLHDVYIARINITPTELARVEGFAPTPGMPAEVMIQTKERTFFNYITKPVTDSMSRAFSEQ